MNKRIFSYFLPYKSHIFLSLFSSIIVAGTNLLIPFIVKNLIDKVLIQKNFYILNLISISIPILFLLKGIFAYVQNYFSQKVALSVSNKLKKELYAHVIALPFSYFKEKHSGDITSYIINDLNLIQSVLSLSFFNGILDFLIVVGSITFLFIINFKMAILSFVLLPLIGFIINYIGKIIRKLSKGIQEKMADLTSHISDSLSGISVIFTFSTQEKEKIKFNQLADEAMALSIKDSKLKSILPPLVEFSLSIGLTFVLWFGGKEVIGGNMTSGELIAFLGYLVLASSPLSRLSNTYYSLKKLQGAFERLFELLDVSQIVAPSKKDIIPKKIDGRIDFIDVSFSYGKKFVFSGLNLSIKPGEKIAIIGPNGEGKSTFLYLLLRLFDPTSGKIMIDNINLKDINIDFLRKSIGIVLQETHLFPGTIYENIVYGVNSVSKEKLDSILDFLGFKEIFKKLPDGINTKIGEKGTKLSGGERHRISLARTLILDPKVLLLDEPTSSLDPSSRKEFQLFLSKIMKGRTTIFITHYREEIEMADRVFLVKNGKIKPIEFHEVDRFFAYE